jgi:DNA-directed RNA polymerase sigma subunit (sigma70/sigma32)
MKNLVEDQMIEILDIGKSEKPRVTMREHLNKMIEGLSPKEREILAKRFADKELRKRDDEETRVKLDRLKTKYGNNDKPNV